MGIFVGEAIGTFLFVYFTLAIISNSIMMDKNSSMVLFVTSMGVGISYIISCLMFGDLTGGHFNPAVTLAVFSINLIEIKYLGYYLGGQILGGIVASITYIIFLGNNEKKCKDEELKIKMYVVKPNCKSVVISFIRESFASYIFMLQLFIITFVLEETSKGETYIFAFLMITIIGMVFNYTTIAFNPIRDIFLRLFFIPKDLKQKVSKLYVVVTLFAPIIGAVLAAYTYKIIPWDKMV